MIVFEDEQNLRKKNQIRNCRIYKHGGSEKSSFFCEIGEIDMAFDYEYVNNNFLKK